MEFTLDVVDRRIGAGEDQVVKGPVLMNVERHLRGPLDVLLGNGSGVIAQVVTVPVAPIVVVARQFVEQLAAVLESPLLEDQHPRPLAIDQQHAETLMALEDGLELYDVRCLVDDQLVADRYTEVDGLEEALGHTAEQGQPSRLGSVEPAFDIRLEPAEIFLDGRAMP
jgi:hypothetical protein